MKVIAVDNYARESIADILICENVNPAYGDDLVNTMNQIYGGENASRFFRLVEDDTRLSRGMEDLV